MPWPVSRDPRENRHPGRKQAYVNAPTEKPRILIVDDDEANIVFLTQALEDDFSIVAARNGTEGVEKAIAVPPPDLVLLDILMPDMDGYEALAELKKHIATREIPVIFLTAKGGVDDEIAGLELGAVDYITKPYITPIVRARIDAQLKIRRQSQELERHALLDPLTEVANRRMYDELIDIEWRRALRESVPLTLIMADVDLFKAYNDQYGHADGDDCLRRVADALRNALSRPGDVVARYGGEEFAIILPDTDEGAAHLMSERVLRAGEDLGIRHEASDVSEVVTVSLGAATARVTQGMEERSLLAAADRALYKAKAGGRNRAEFEVVA